MIQSSAIGQLQVSLDMKSHVVEPVHHNSLGYEVANGVIYVQTDYIPPQTWGTRCMLHPVCIRCASDLTLTCSAPLVFFISLPHLH